MSDFFKYHALGNDYLVIDPNEIEKDFVLTKDKIRLICNRNYGVGADGILYGPIIKDKLINFQIFNPDGSEAEKSGNGIRIFALYLLDKKYISGTKCDLYTKGGKVSVEVIDTITNLIKVEIGEYSFISVKIPVHCPQHEAIDVDLEILGKIEKINCVTVGNPHCVIFKKNVIPEFAKTFGPYLENNAFFHNKTNVQIVEIVDTSNIKIEIWERGAGYTLSSGTSSAAASCVAFRHGLVKNSVTVHMPGGTILVEIDNNIVYITGTVNRIFRGDFDYDFKFSHVSKFF